jgi:hypothetical protein
LDGIENQESGQFSVSSVATLRYQDCVKPEKPTSERSPQDPAQLISILENAEITARLTRMEKAVEKLESSIVERHIQHINRFFTVTALLIGLFGALLTYIGPWRGTTAKKQRRKPRPTCNRLSLIWKAGLRPWLAMRSRDQHYRF